MKSLVSLEEDFWNSISKFVKLVTSRDSKSNKVTLNLRQDSRSLKVSPDLKAVYFEVSRSGSLEGLCVGTMLWSRSTAVGGCFLVVIILTEVVI